MRGFAICVIGMIGANAAIPQISEWLAVASLALHYAYRLLPAQLYLFLMP